MEISKEENFNPIKQDIKKVRRAVCSSSTALFLG